MKGICTSTAQTTSGQSGIEHQTCEIDLIRIGACLFAFWLVGCLTSQQHASVSQGRICSDKFTCCHTQTEVADPTFHLTHSQYTDTGPTNPSTDPKTPGAWQGSHWSANLCHWNDSTLEKSRDSNIGSSALEADALTTRPTRRSPYRGKDHSLLSSSLVYL